ncbi:hypothetical protein GCM10009836_72970 [Pseudonocardia ailaonensis]|uniref:Uncharacterized protein n=1 Tax=Pseudonocardia ailaonensis TaxID=367279 RepID=A0ABN2NPQ4_9PSEU
MAETASIGRHRLRRRRHPPMPTTSLFLAAILVMLVIAAGLTTICFVLPALSSGA